LSSVQVDTLAARLGDPLNTKKYHGASDVDTSRVDRTDAWLAVAGADGLVQLLSVAYCKSVYVLPGHCEPILALTSGRSGTCLASLSHNFIIIWNLPLLARHHYNAFHYGGPGLDQIIDHPADWTHAQAQLPFPINQLATEHTRWILQVIPTPSRLLTMLEFTQFGLVAGASSGHLYCWPFASSDRFVVSAVSIAPSEAPCFDLDSSVSSQEIPLGLGEMSDMGPRQQPGKRPAPGQPPTVSVWANLPVSVVDTGMCHFLDWPHRGEQVCALAKVRSNAPSIPLPSLAVRTSANRLVVFAPTPFLRDASIPHQISSTEPKLQTVELFQDFQLPVAASSNGLQTTFNPSGKLTTDESYEIRHKRRSFNQSLGVSFDGRFALVGDALGDAFLLDLASGSLISKLEHKRSKTNVSACVIAHHTKNVAFASDAMLWRWDFISPSFLHKERAEQARAEAEGVDIPQYEPEDDAPDDLI
jgi:WD40 repeat protein